MTKSISFKLGDVVYIPKIQLGLYYGPAVHEFTVISASGGGNLVTVFVAEKVVENTHFGETHYRHEFTWADIGRSVFLTREEAEKRLRQMIH